ncbi:pentapeptide repeat-containing protein [Methanothrix harundinacea]|uniref:pentapeptide repeat-containing protein n=1 Tax=Methanothrix harundinacea TaxID=301375 RepID=UPI00117DD675|nr:pentapeptide repeat-containing protein [Methanothrix harundinacea]
MGSFVNSVFCRDSNFLESHFIGNANFGGTVFYRGPSFEAVNFEKNASFDLAEFKSEPSFNGAYFKRDATFNYAIFCKSVYFVGVNFGGDANYTKTTFNKPVYLKEAIFSRFNVEWRQIKDKIDCDGATYLLLVRSFKNLEQFDNADDCYYDYREWRRNSNDVSTEKRSNWSKLYDFVSYASCGYGVRLRFPLAWIFGSIFGLTFLYHIFDGITKSSPHEITMISLNNSTMLFSSAYAETAPSFWECLYFSSLSFAGGTPVGLSPVGVWKYAVMMESVLGYLFLALFVVVLARKLIR